MLSAPHEWKNWSSLWFTVCVALVIAFWTRDHNTQTELEIARTDLATAMADRAPFIAEASMGLFFDFAEGNWAGSGFTFTLQLPGDKDGQIVTLQRENR